MLQDISFHDSCCRGGGDRNYLRWRNQRTYGKTRSHITKISAVHKISTDLCTLVSSIENSPPISMVMLYTFIAVLSVAVLGTSYRVPVISTTLDDKEYACPGEPFSAICQALDNPGLSIIGYGYSTRDSLWSRDSPSDLDVMGNTTINRIFDPESFLTVQLNSTVPLRMREYYRTGIWCTGTGNFDYSHKVIVVNTTIC